MANQFVYGGDFNYFIADSAIISHGLRVSQLPTNLPNYKWRFSCEQTTPISKPLAHARGS